MGTKAKKLNEIMCIGWEEPPNVEGMAGQVDGKQFLVFNESPST